MTSNIVLFWCLKLLTPIFEEANTKRESKNYICVFLKYTDAFKMLSCKKERGKFVCAGMPWSAEYFGTWK